MQKKKWLWRGLLTLILLAVLSIGGISAYVSWSLTHPDRQPLAATPKDYGLQYEEVAFTGRGDGVKLKGWLLPAKNSSHTVIFAHGYGKNRLQEDVPALTLAKELVTQGYNVLLFDFRNSGTSGGDITSVGQYEVNDLLGAVDYMKAKGPIGRHVALLGFSMGAATGILTAAREPEVEAVVADSPFADLTAYLEENLPVWSHLPAVPFNRAIMTLAPPVTGLEPSAVSPVREIGKIQGPILLIHGDADHKIPLINSEKLLQAANSPDKRLLVIKGADHVKGFATDRPKYLQETLGFLNKWRSQQPSTISNH